MTMVMAHARKLGAGYNFITAGHELTASGPRLRARHLPARTSYCELRDCRDGFETKKAPRDLRGQDKTWCNGPTYRIRLLPTLPSRAPEPRHGFP
jgi:hypothetical protein